MKGRQNREGGGEDPRKGRDQILQRSVVEPQSFKPEGPNAYNLKIWLQPSGNHAWSSTSPRWRRCRIRESLCILRRGGSGCWSFRGCSGCILGIDSIIKFQLGLKNLLSVGLRFPTLRKSSKQGILAGNKKTQKFGIFCCCTADSQWKKGKISCTTTKNLPNLCFSPLPTFFRCLTESKLNLKPFYKQKNQAKKFPIELDPCVVVAGLHAVLEVRNLEGVHKEALALVRTVALSRGTSGQNTCLSNSFCIPSSANLSV